MVAGKMGELALPRDVAYGIDAFVRGLEAVVHLHAVRIEGDLRLFEAELFDVGLAARGDENVAGLQHLAAMRGHDLQRHAGFDGADGGDMGCIVQDHAFAPESLGNDRCRFRVFAREDAGILDQRDIGAEAAMGLRQFDTHRPAADDDEMGGNKIFLKIFSLVKKAHRRAPEWAGPRGGCLWRSQSAARGSWHRQPEPCVHR